MKLELSRRRALALAAALLPLRAAAQIAPGTGSGPEFFGAFRVDRNALKRFVELYLDSYPREADARRLEELLFGQGGTLPVQEKKRQILAKIEQDFREDKTVIVDGWILSRTEVRLWSWMYELSY